MKVKEMSIGPRLTRLWVTFILPSSHRKLMTLGRLHGILPLANYGDPAIILAHCRNICCSFDMFGLTFLC